VTYQEAAGLVGVTKGCFSNWVNGHVKPGAAKLNKLNSLGWLDPIESKPATTTKRAVEIKLHKRRRKSIDWAKMTNVYLQHLKPGMALGEWYRVVKHAGYDVSVSSTRDCIRILKGDGRGNRKITPRIQMIGSKSKARYYALAGATAVVVEAKTEHPEPDSPKIEEGLHLRVCEQALAIEDLKAEVAALNVLCNELKSIIVPKPLEPLVCSTCGGLSKITATRYGRRDDCEKCGVHSWKGACLPSPKPSYKW